MKAFYKVIAGEIVAARGILAAKLDLIVGNDAQVVGSKCESGLPQPSPHSSTYSYLTLHATIGQLNNAYLLASNNTKMLGKGRKTRFGTRGSK